MTRRPQDAISQRQLIFELKAAIDRAERVQSDAAWAKVDALIAENPHAARSTHVTRNLGARRFEWLIWRAGG